MPVFKQEKIEKKKRGRASSKELDRALIDQYRPFVEQLEKGHRGVLEFKKDEAGQINKARRALQQAGEEAKKYVRVRRKRGEDALQFERITRKEYMDSKKKAKARGKKIAKARKKPRTKAKKKS